MDLHITLDRMQPLRAQVERQLRDGIRSGRLQAGVRLPPTRLLAGELGVSRGVVVEAYAQLSAEGYLVTQYGGGTRVAPGLVQSEPSRRRPGPARSIRFDLRTGLPDTSLFPRRAWNSATATALRDLPDAALLYGPPQGARGLRRAISEYLGRARAVVADEEQTFITCGSSHAFGLVWQALRGRRLTRVAHEDPAWRRIPATIEHAGLEAVPIAVDRHGLSVAALAASGAQAVVVSPAHQYPTGVMMHPRRRAELIRWARETGGLIVEDDYDAEYRFDGNPIAPLRSLAPDSVAYVGTASKVLAPALRIGWLLVPDDLVEVVAVEHGVSYAQPSIIDQAAFATLLTRGDLDRHLRRTRRTYRDRRAALITAASEMLPSVRLSGGAAGLHLMAWLPAGVNEAELAAAAAHEGVAVDGLHLECAIAGQLGPALILGYGSIAEPAIPVAVSHLAGCLESDERQCA